MKRGDKRRKYLTRDGYHIVCAKMLSLIVLLQMLCRVRSILIAPRKLQWVPCLVSHISTKTAGLMSE